MPGNITSVKSYFYYLKIVFYIARDKFYIKSVRYNTFDIPKPDGGVRTIAYVHSHPYRIVLYVIKIVLDHLYFSQYVLPNNFGYIRGLNGTYEIIASLIDLNPNIVLDMDIRKYFDNVIHSKLIDMLFHVGISNILIKLIIIDLQAPIGNNVPKGIGIKQGSIIRPALSNYYLIYFDILMFNLNIYSFRYVDNIFVACASKEEANNTLIIITNYLKSLGLELKPESVHILDFLIPGTTLNIFGTFMTKSSDGNFCININIDQLTNSYLDVSSPRRRLFNIMKSLDNESDAKATYFSKLIAGINCYHRQFEFRNVKFKVEMKTVTKNVEVIFLNNELDD